MSLIRDENKTAVVIVTFNRKDLLVECIDAVLKQEFIPNKIYIIDNASTDNTLEKLIESKFLVDATFNELENENLTIKNTIKSTFDSSVTIDLHYEKKKINDGGAGGFNFGIKKAYNDGFDWVWIMDDDGLPDKKCLLNLKKISKKGTIDYLAPNLIDKKGQSHFSDKFKNTPANVINYYGGPFNGILLSNYLIENIGLPIKEFFIWGDEMEYKNRIMEKGFTTITVKDAIHHHKRTSFNIKKVPRVYYYIRNKIFCTRLFEGVYRSKKANKFGVLFAVSRVILNGVISFNFKQVIGCVKGIKDGLSVDVKSLQKSAIDFN